MTIDIENIVRDVRIILDENEDQAALLGSDDFDMDNDAIQTDGIVRKYVLESIDRVHQMAPVDMLGESMINADVEWSRYELTQRATLPSDMLRLAYVKMEGWSRGVSTFVNEGSALYSTMFSRFMSVRPSANHPMVGISRDMEGNEEIVAAPVSSDSGNKGFVGYVPFAKDGGIISEKCYKAVLWMIANLYYTTVKEQETADRMASEVAELLGIGINKTETV